MYDTQNPNLDALTEFHDKKVRELPKQGRGQIGAM